MIESLGPPHCEVDLITVDGQPVGFDYVVESAGHGISVYGDARLADCTNKIRLRPVREGRPRFVLDTHLGRLASYLRMLGFDTLYRNDYPDDELAHISNTQERILLTRDIGLLKRSLVVYGYFIRARKPAARMVEVIERFALYDHIRPFRHCLKCNGLVERVDQTDISDSVPHTILDRYDEFHQCVDCQRVYWKGSHYDRMQQFMHSVLNGNYQV